jgi:hypothetical protein
MMMLFVSVQIRTVGHLKVTLHYFRQRHLLVLTLCGINGATRLDAVLIFSV